QWEEGTTAGGPWFALAGETNQTGTAVYDGTRPFYRCRINCTFGGVETITTPVNVLQNAFNVCYCNNPAIFAGDEDIFNVTLGTLNNSSTCATTGGAGSILERYANYTGVPAPVLVQGTPYPMSVLVGTCGFEYTMSMRAWIDYNQDGNFSLAELIYQGPVITGWTGTHTFSTSITPPLSATPGVTGMRVIVYETPDPATLDGCATYNWGETEDYLVNITVPPPCAGIPSASAANASLAGPVCPGDNLVLSLSPTYSAGGLTFQWERSSDNITWFAIPGQTNQTANIAQTQASYYRCIVECAAFPGPTTSTATGLITQTPLFSCYCTSSADFAGDTEIFNVSFGGTLNNTTNCAQTGTTGSILSRYSNYTNLGPFNVDKGILQSFSMRAGTCGGPYTAGVTVFIDYNANGTFEAGERLFTSSTLTPSTGAGTLVSGTITIPLGAVNGPTVMRVILAETFSPGTIAACGTYGWGETEDYVINITAPPPCVGTPATPAMPGSPIEVLNATTTTIAPTGVTSGLGISYLWEEGPAVGGPFVPATGANTNTTYTTPAAAGSVWYRLVTTCTFSGLTSTSGAVEVRAVGGASCADPYLITAVPFQGNFSTVASGNNIGSQGCSGAYGTGNDYIFQVNLTAGVNYEVSVANTSGTNWIAAFLKDNCTSTTAGSSLICATSGGSNSAVGIATVPTTGTYWIVVDYFPAPSSSNFFVRIRQTPGTPGSGTTPFNAIGTTQSATPTCSGVVGSTANAGASGEPTVCGGTADDDVWYSFVATATAVDVNVDPGNNGVANSGADIAVELYGGTAAALGPGLCLNNSTAKGAAETGTIVGLVVGNTYYIRIYDNNVLWGSNLGNFTLCLTTPPPPVNDDCAGAVVLPVNAGCVNTIGNTVSATLSQAAIACSGFTGNADDDVWYRVDLAVASDLNIRVTATGTAMDPVVQLFSGSCAGLTAQFCEDRSITGGSELISRSLGAGAYFIRVFHYGLGTGAGGGHSICAFTTTPSPRPANDEITGATTVPFVVDCSPLGPFTSTNATLTHTNSISPVVGNANDDVWYKFVATAGYANIIVQGGAGYNPVIQMFTITGNKTIATEFPAVNATGANGAEEVTYYGLSVGTTYFVRVYDFGAGNPTGNFTICVFRTPPPSNDLCIGAISIFQQNSATCVTPTFGFTLSATPDLAAAPCAGTSDDDVFYTFVATSPNPTIEVTGIQGFDPVLNLRSGPGCGTSIQCANATGVDGTEVINAAGLTVGQTYRIRIYSAGNGTPFMGVFNVCVYGIAVPPANDNCAGAFNLPNTSPCTSVNGLVTGATQSQPGCAGNANDDVWYQFIAANTTSTVTVVGGIGFDAVVQVFSGGCGSLVSLGCQDATGSGTAENLVLSGLIPGNTYYVRTYHWSAADASTPNFSVCLTGQPPINDDALGAINLTLRQDITPSITNATNLGATNNIDPSIDPGTFGNFRNDVWYKATIGDNGVLAVNVQPTTIGDTRLRLYSGDPLVALTQISSDDDGGPGVGSYSYISGRTPGEVVYICVDGFTLTTFGNFNIQASDGWVWDGQGGFAYNGTGNWINQNLGEGVPAPGPTTIVNIPIGGGVVNQPIVTTGTTLGGIYFKSSFFTAATLSINTGITLNMTLDETNPGRTIRGTGSFARIQGPGILSLNSAGAAPINVGLGLGTVRFGGSNPIAVTVSSGYSINSNGKMVFENGSSLYSGGANGLVNGNITYRRQGNGSQYAYNYWGSPITAGTLASLSAPGYIANTYEYITSNTTGVDYAGTQAGWNPLGPGDVMTPGRGYIATGAGLATFSGVPNQVNTPVVTTSGAINFNLVSNPFPAPLAAALFLSQNASAGSAIYVWDDDVSNGVDYTAGDYVVSNGVGTINGPNSGAPFSGNIASCQGFFIDVTSAGSVNFNLTQRAAAGSTNSQFFETNVDEMLKLRIENSVEQSSETIIAFRDVATESYDQGIDVRRLPGNTSIALYTMVGAEQIAFNYFSPLTAERIVPLKVLNVFDGTASITMNQFDNFDGTTVVYLEDVVNGTFHNLTENPTYTFSDGSVTESEDRFRIHFRAPIAVATSSDCSGQGLGKMILNNPNTTSVTAEIRGISSNEVYTTAAFGAGTASSEVVIEGLSADNYDITLSYTDGTNASKQAQIADGGIPVAASFQASATNVTIADAIIEFLGNAPGATSYSWNFGDGSVVEGDLNPVHAYMAPGIYTVTFMASNGGCVTEFSQTINVSAVTGIANVDPNLGFSIYPNPASTNANLLLNIDRSESQVIVRIHDAQGRLISSENVNDVRAGSIVELNIAGLADGVYQVTVEGNSFKNTSRLTIAK
ncbi:MAG: GEVED domain-containing protein, partial [Bacteroidia bacterium]